jgi:hypothetical protein
MRTSYRFASATLHRPYCATMSKPGPTGAVASPAPAAFAYIDADRGATRDPQGVDAVPKPVSTSRVAAAVEVADVVRCQRGDAAPDPDVPAQPANREGADYVH